MLFAFSDIGYNELQLNTVSPASTLQHFVFLFSPLLIISNDILSPSILAIQIVYSVCVCVCVCVLI